MTATNRWLLAIITGLLLGWQWDAPSVQQEAEAVAVEVVSLTGGK